MRLIMGFLLFLRQELELVGEFVLHFNLLLFLLIQKVAQVRAEPLNVQVEHLLIIDGLGSIIRMCSELVEGFPYISALLS